MRERRESFGLTQQEVAEKLGVQRVTYARWELGRVSITAADLRKVAKLFGVTLNFFVLEPGGKPAEELIYEPVIDELHMASSDGSFTAEDAEELADMVRARAERRRKRREG